MVRYTKRVQTVLTATQYEKLLALAEKEDKPVSVLIREAVEEQYFVPLAREKRQRALESLLALDAPVADWDEMEAEIEQGAVDG